TGGVIQTRRPPPLGADAGRIEQRAERLVDRWDLGELQPLDVASDAHDGTGHDRALGQRERCHVLEVRPSAADLDGIARLDACGRTCECDAYALGHGASVVVARVYRAGD